MYGKSHPHWSGNSRIQRNFFLIFIIDDRIASCPSSLNTQSNLDTSLLFYFSNVKKKTYVKNKTYPLMAIAIYSAYSSNLV